MLTETKLRRLHRRFEHFSIKRFYQILNRSNHDVKSQIINHFTKFCHHCQVHTKFSSQFNFTLKDDLKFNYNVIMNIFYIEIKNVNKSLLHFVKEIICFQANK
jgi:predicted secreted protein